MVDLASGAGGFSDGAELALDCPELVGFDWSYPARASYRHGLAGYRRCYPLDLFQPAAAIATIRRALGGRQPDWVIGSSSCKPWTPAGRREGKRDGRDTLLAWSVVAGAIAPRYGIIMENVPNAQRHPDWAAANAAIGLPNRTMWTLRASDYGAPTTRRRTFWVWRRDDLQPAMPPETPVAAAHASIIKGNGKRNAAGEVCYLIGYQSGDRGWTGERLYTNAEALAAIGAAGKLICGGRHASAQQIADMIPPQLAAAVLAAVIAPRQAQRCTFTAEATP